MRLRIPADVSITGFDKLDLAQLLDPPLATVNVPHRRMGHSAAKMLLALRQSGTTLGSIVFDTEIIEGVRSRRRRTLRRFPLRQPGETGMGGIVIPHGSSVVWPQRRTETARRRRAPFAGCRS